MFKSCPISSRRIDSNLVRFISAQVSIVTMLLIVTKMPVFAIILLIDFVMRAFRKPNFSPFFIMARFGISIFRLKPKMCDEAPKRFAMFMGLVISLTLSILYIGHNEYISSTIAFILFGCAMLETLFDFCLGCKIYQIIKIVKKSS